MKTNAFTALKVCLDLLLAVGALGCGGSDGDGVEMIASSDGEALMVYADPYAPDMAGMPNPIPNTATATAEAFDVGGKLRIVLQVQGFPATRRFGSHLHQLPCDDPMKAGGHYQNMPFPVGGMATHPAYANATNEAWLDFTTSAMGEGAADLTVSWLPRPGEAQAIIIHHMASGVGGVSGPKLACLPIVGL